MGILWTLEIDFAFASRRPLRRVAHLSVTLDTNQSRNVLETICFNFLPARAELGLVESIYRMPRTASSDEAREKGQNRQRQVELTQNLAVPPAYLVMNVTID